MSSHGVWMQDTSQVLISFVFYCVVKFSGNIPYFCHGGWFPYSSSILHPGLSVNHSVTQNQIFNGKGNKLCCFYILLIMLAVEWHKTSLDNLVGNHSTWHILRTQQIVVFLLYTTRRRGLQLWLKFCFRSVLFYPVVWNVCNYVSTVFLSYIIVHIKNKFLKVFLGQVWKLTVLALCTTQFHIVTSCLTAMIPSHH